jgi:hypothetical protein
VRWEQISSRPRGEKTPQQAGVWEAGPVMAKPSPTPLRTLWRARLNIGGRGDEFYFRETDDITAAVRTAAVLLESSPAARMSGAVIVSVEREASLWN